MLLALARFALIVEAAVGSLDCLAAAASWCGLRERVGIGEGVGLRHGVGGCDSSKSDCVLVGDQWTVQRGASCCP
jgi:hypothetical protein